MKKKVPLMLLTLAFLAIMLFSAWQLFGIFFEYHQGESTYDDLSQYAVTPAPTPEPAPEATPTPDDTVWPEVDFDALKAINDDVVAWIYLEDTHINYPVVQGSNNEYYLNRLYNGKQNGAGSIFMDFRNSGKFTDRNSILYGHRMNNGTMFANLSKYSNQEFFDSHPYVLIITPDAKYKAEVFSAYIANTTYSSWDTVFDGDRDYLNWLESLQSRSYFNRNVEFTGDSRIVTLSTCTYEFEDARFVVHAVLHEIE